MGPESILEASGLWKTYGPRGPAGRGRNAGRPALIDASISLHRGEVLGVVGESGSGKTTLARCLALLERPDSGTVRLDGEELTALPIRALRQRRRRIQTVFQDPYASLNPRIRVGEAIAEVIRVHRLAPRGEVDAKVGRLIDLVGLPRAAAGRFPTEFSGGQRQRICIARALAAEPDVLIADEPVSALDVSIRAQILNLLLDLRDQFGLSIVFIGHDLFVVDFIGDRIAVMLGGQVVEILPAAGRLGAALHPYSRELIAAAPTIAVAGALEAETSDGPVGGAPPVIGCPYLQRCPYRSDPRCATEYPKLAPVGDGHYIASFCELTRVEAPAAPIGN
jgi:ABC-type glutathione transport system ATPase component